MHQESGRSAGVDQEMRERAVTAAVRRRIDLCPHCGNRTALEHRAQYTVREADPQEDGMYWVIEWALLECVSCSRPLLDEIETEDFGYAGSRSEVTTTLYPMISGGSRDGLPEGVAEAYDAAARVRLVSPSAYAVLVGRLLERICLDKLPEAKGTLFANLRLMADEKLIPGPLADMADQLRQIRNLGAHAHPDDEVQPDDVPAITEFTEAIIEYLYRAPAKVEAVRARLQRQVEVTSEG
jgi:hypothetical protein